MAKPGDRSPAWTDAEIDALRSLSLASLPELPPDPSNAVADDPQAARLASSCFLIRALAPTGASPARPATSWYANSQMDCLTDRLLAHQNAIRQALSVAHTVPGCTGTVDGTASGHRLCLPSKTRTNMAPVACRSSLSFPGMTPRFQALFGDPGDVSGNDPVTLILRSPMWAKRLRRSSARSCLPHHASMNTSTLLPTVMKKGRSCCSVDDEVWGLRLFIGKANCTQCHNGPLSTNDFTIPAYSVRRATYLTKAA